MFSFFYCETYHECLFCESFLFLCTYHVVDIIISLVTVKQNESSFFQRVTSHCCWWLANRRSYCPPSPWRLLTASALWALAAWAEQACTTGSPSPTLTMPWWGLVVTAVFRAIYTIWYVVYIEHDYPCTSQRMPCELWLHGPSRPVPLVRPVQH